MRSVTSIRLIAAACLTVGLGGISAHAAVLEVGVGQTYSTIQSAYNAATSGDTINIHAGTYNNDLSLNASAGTNNITFQANKDLDGNYDKVVISNDSYTYMRYRSGMIFDGLIFASNGNYAVYARTGFRNATFKNTIFYAPNGDGLYAYGGDGNVSDITIENATFYDASTIGLRRANTTTEWTVKDSLFISNGTYGASGGSETTAIDNSAFSGNVTAAVDGTYFTLGTNSTTDAVPIFASTDINNPYFLYLDPSSPQSILTGDSDGGFKGARGVVPEPASLALLGLSVAGLCLRRPRESRG